MELGGRIGLHGVGKNFLGLSEIFYLFVVVYQNSSNCTLKYILLYIVYAIIVDIKRKILKFVI